MHTHGVRRQRIGGHPGQSLPLVLDRATFNKLPDIAIEGSIASDDKIRATILGQKNGQVKVGIDAPKEVPFVREELLERD